MARQDTKTTTMTTYVEDDDTSSTMSNERDNRRGRQSQLQ
jgi:hypothetical protein